MAVHLDDILVKFNIFGHYYVRSMFLLFFVYLANNMFCMSFVFVAESVGYRCKDKRFFNQTCSCINNSTDLCTEWVYDNPYSFVAEFQLACQEWKRTLVGSIHSMGYMMGLLIAGPLSDRIGRKKVVVITGFLAAVLGVAKSYTRWYWMFILLEFLEAALANGSSPAFMLCIEMVAHEKKLVYQMLCGFGFSFGYLSLAINAWLFPYWRQMLRVMYRPSVLFVSYYYLLDESPRWLLSRGHKREAVNILKKIARKNKTKIADDELESISYEESSGIKFLILLKATFTSKTLLKRFFICLSWWVASTFVNYGMQIASVSLSGNKYINFGMMMVAEFLGNVTIIFIMLKFGRKKPLISSFILTAAFCYALPFVPTNCSWVSVFLFMIGKLLSASYFTITYIYTSELFPTYTRNSMHALCSSLGRVGSIVAPQTPLLRIYWEGLPAIFFGCVSLIAGLATLFVPDTLDDSLPDTVIQAEALGTKSDKADSALIPLTLKDSRQLQ